MLMVVVAVAGCGSKQHGAAGGRCDRIPAGTKLALALERGGGIGPPLGDGPEDIRDGEYVVDGVRRWGVTFGESSDGSIAWMVETPTQIRIGFTRNSSCGGIRQPRSAIAVKVPNTGKPIVAEQCGGQATCDPNVP